ncbi:S8 family serine peptidase [Alteribacillus sp. HJP-4]|uniref:S8 family serine peptidase n=1 Tax=Alteribacillus sp. HJP-4 TaxID=2775394 RepID=UPI0035CCDADF
MDRLVRWPAAVLAAGLFVAGLVPASAAAVSEAEEDASYLVGFDGDVDVRAVEDAGGVVGDVWDSVRAAEVQLTDSEAAELSSSDGVRYVERDQEVAVRAPDNLRNWGLEHVGAPSAWDAGFSGEGIDVAVVDTGISTTHPSLSVVDGFSAVSYTDSYDDDNGHGTHAAGILAADQEDAGLVGIAPDADLHAVKVLDEEGNGSLSRVISGLEWAIEQDVDVINMSFGTLTDSSTMKAMLDEAYDEGVIVAAAAGNRGEAPEDSNRVEFPARYDSVVAVGAVDENNKRASFSAAGDEVELVAPGVDIVSTYKGSSYGPLSGTSMATPFVAGTFAVLMEAYPDASGAQLRTLLQENAVDLGADGRDKRYGYGLLQIPSLDGDGSLLDGGSSDDEDADLDNGEVEEEPIEDEEPVPDEDGPARPAGVEGEVVYSEDGTSADLYLFWERNEDAAAHRVYRDGELVEEVKNGKLYKEKDVKPGTYEYEVSAVDIDGMESRRSDKVEMTVDLGEDEPEGAFTWPERLDDPPSFADVSDDYWAVTEIRELSSRGVINGSDGFYKPNESVRRAQAVAMVGRLLQWDEDGFDGQFRDVSEEFYAAGYIGYAVEEGILRGYPDGTFQPNRPITRGQMASIVENAFDLDLGSVDADSERFVDVNEDTNGQLAILYLEEAGIVQGYGDSFRPGAPLTRAQFAKVMHQLGEHLQEE